MQVGLRPPALAGQGPQAPNLAMGGVLNAQSLASMQAQAHKEAQALSAAQQAEPVITNLSSHVKSFYTIAQSARIEVENAMIEALYARRGRYTDRKLAEIRQSGQPAIYMLLASTKMRQAESLLRDILMGTGVNKPWSVNPTPVPELPPFEVNQIRQALTTEVEQAIMMGLEPTIEDIRERLMAAKQQLEERMREAAILKADAMEAKMEDQLFEGGFDLALDQFITDLTTFKTAFIAGPIVRRKPKLTYAPTGKPIVTVGLTLEWERVDPFDMYPAPWARHINEGPMIRKHRLTRQDLTEMIGVEGYSEADIKMVLEVYGTRGRSDWTSIDSQRARAEGKLTDTTLQSGLIDALQYWGSVSGQMLVDWGMSPTQVPDLTKEYQVEAWVCGDYTIKATLNADPLARRPYYADSYERIPGSVWGNGVFDLMVDCQSMCNSAARSLAGNMGVASGPQVDISVDRLAPGEKITEMYPWKIWQTTSDPMGSTRPAISFFQPQSNATELMGVFEKFSAMADDYTGIPKYTVGAESAGGAGRTASGMSMMLGNASKIIKSVVAGVDVNIFGPMLNRLYYMNMRYSSDPDLKGDVLIRPMGAQTLAVKEAAAQRRQQFLVTTNNPTDMAIIGMEGRAEVLRAEAQTLDLNASKVVPPVAVIKERARAAALQSGMMAGQAPQGGGSASPPGPQGPAVTAGNGQALLGPDNQPGAPVTDNFQPTPGASV